MAETVMRGGKTPRWMTDATEPLAKTLPRATYTVLPKQTHQVNAEVIAPVLVEFLGA